MDECISQFSIIEPGAFRTNALETGVVKTPIHPAYAGNPALGSAFIRRVMDVNDGPGSVDKAAKLLYGLAELPDPPLHVPLGKDSVANARRKIASFSADVEKVAWWSDDIDRET